MVFLLFVSTTALAEAKPYPDRWKQVQTFDDLQHVYWKIYKDTNYEDEETVLERLKWYEGDFTKNELNAYRKLEAPQIGADEDYTWFEQLRTSDTLQWYFLYEKELLRLENDIDLRNWIETMFVNDSLADSPFDLIEDLHRIDKLLFGKKFNTQKPKKPLFIKYDTEQKKLCLKTEDWQDGRETRGFLARLLGNRKYGKTIEKKEDGNGEEEKNKNYPSITGYLSNLRRPFRKLLSHQLIRGKAAEQFMEPGTTKTTSGDTYGAGIAGYAPPSADSSPPESETVLIARPWDEQSGTAKQKLTGMSDLSRNSNANMGQLISNVIKKTEGKEGTAEDRLERQLTDWKNGMEFREKKTYHNIINARLSFWNQDIEAMLEGFISIRKILDEFLKIKIES